MIKSKLDSLGAHSIPSVHPCNNTHSLDRYLSKEQIETLNNYNGLISFTNGAKTRLPPSTAKKSICDKNGYISIDFLYGLGNDEYGIAYNTKKHNSTSYELDDFLIIGESPGGDKICLSKKNGGIYFWDHESENIDDALHFIAPDFSCFINNLEDDIKTEGNNKRKKTAWVNLKF